MNATEPLPRSKLWVDPGFVHHRLIEGVLGPQGSDLISKEVAKIPASEPDWRRAVLADHIYSRILIDFADAVELKTLEEVLAEQRGHMFCSIVKLTANEAVYRSDRVAITCGHSFGKSLKVELHLSPSRIASDTLRSGLAKGGEFAVVAQFRAKQGNTLVFHPLLIGFPYLRDPKTHDLQWSLYTDYYRVYAEQFEEFSRVANDPLPSSFEEMKDIPERVVKQAFAQHLQENAPKDWGGETSDFFTSHLHIEGRRVSAAFLLKGPAKFVPMKLRHLGKNGDQIVRLSHEPADILIVQHCHDILPQVIETLKVFATQPSRPKRYCLIDGRETLRILRTYDLLPKAALGTAR